MSLPDLTKAQLLAVAQAVIAAAVAFGAPLSPDQQKSLLALAALVAGLIVAADVKIRGNRAAHADKIAAASQPALPSHSQASASSGVTVKDVKVGPAGGVGVHVATPPKKPAAKKKPTPKKGGR